MRYQLFPSLAAAAANLIFQPTVVHIDFEIAVINSLRQQLNVDATGCLFHFTQSIYRKIQALDMQQAYNTDNPVGIRKWLRRLMAIPLLPPLRLDATFNAIELAAPNIPRALDMHQYMRNTYVGPGALFNQVVWNVFNSRDRTTNICEGFHSGLNKAMGHQNPTVFKVISYWQELDMTNERVLAQMQLGAPPRSRKKGYIRLDETIVRLTNNTFGQGTIPSIAQVLDYLDAIAFQLWDIKH